MGSSQDRPSRLGQDFAPTDVWTEKFPEVKNVRLSDLPRQEAPVVDRLGDEEALAAFRSALATAAGDGESVSPQTLAEAATRSRATVHRWLEEGMQEGTVDRVGTGAYRWVGKVPATT